MNGHGQDDPQARPCYFILDTESVPDGRLLAKAKYADQPDLTPEKAVALAQAEARMASPTGSDFIPVSFQYPVAMCVLRVGEDHHLQAISCLDVPHFRPRKIVEQFWQGVSSYRSRFGDRVKLVTFNGRGFDLPLLELAAFRYGLSAGEHFGFGRKRFDGGHLDLMDWLTNYGAYRLVGGLNLLSKLLGNPGKMDVKGDQVYQLHLEGKGQEINDYCMFDTLDTYFVFLRTRVLAGILTLEQEHICVLKAKEWIASKVPEMPALKRYLDNWGDWNPWP